MPPTKMKPRQPSVVEVVQKRVSNEDFIVAETEDPGISLLFDPAAKTIPQIKQSEISKIGFVGTDYLRIKSQINQLEDDKDTAELQLKKIPAEEYRSFRGIQYNTTGYRLAIFPESSIEFNLDKLRGALGSLFDIVVSPIKLRSTITIPEGKMTKKGRLDLKLFKRVVRRGLRKELGLTNEELDDLLVVEEKGKIIDKVLAEVIKTGQVPKENVRLINRAGKVTTGYAIRPTKVEGPLPAPKRTIADHKRKNVVNRKVNQAQK